MVKLVLVFVQIASNINVEILLHAYAYVYEGGVRKPLIIKKQRLLEFGHSELVLHVPIETTDKLCFSDYGHFVIEREWV